MSLSKAFIEYSNDRNDIYENIDKYNPNRKHKTLILFDNMIADMRSTKKRQPVVTELLFTRVRKLKISVVFITQSYFAVPKTKSIRLKSTHYFIMKIPNKREFQKIAINYSSDINFKDVL